MKAEFSIYLPEEDYDELVAGEITIEDFLIKLFESVDNDDDENLHDNLLAYHSDNGGAPEITESDMEDVIYDPETLSGSFICFYTVEFFYTCSDLGSSKNDSLNWNFQIDLKEWKIKFIGEEIPEREPDEY